MNKNSKNPILKSLMGSIFPKLERFFPKLAQRLYIHLFFRPIKVKIPKREINIYNKAQSYSISVNNKKVMVYEWGKGKPMLFVHGWMGRAGQFNKLIEHYTEMGYKCISFDAPGHGYSSGIQTNLFEWAKIISILNESYGGFEFVFGHSLGSLSCLFANVNNAITNNLVLISMAAETDFIIDEFEKEINASQKFRPALQKHFHREFKMDISKLKPSELLKQQEVFLLLVHDIEDQRIPHQFSQNLYFEHSNSELFLTKGLGHNRILSDVGTIKKINQFLNGGRNQEIILDQIKVTELQY